MCGKEARVVQEEAPGRRLNTESVYESVCPPATIYSCRGFKSWYDWNNISLTPVEGMAAQECPHLFSGNWVSSSTKPLTLYLKFCAMQQTLLIQTEVMMDRKEPYYNSDSDNVNVIINFNVKVNSQIGWLSTMSICKMIIIGWWAQVAQIWKYILISWLVKCVLHRREGPREDISYVIIVTLRMSDMHKWLACKKSCDWPRDDKLIWKRTPYYDMRSKRRH